MSAHDPTISNGSPCVVAHHPEGVLDPDVVSVAMAEAIFDAYLRLVSIRGPISSKTRLASSWMQTDGPEILVLEHLPGGEAHDAGDVLADEGAGVVARLIGVDDRRRDGHEVAQPLARGLQFGGAVLDALLQLVMRPAKLLLLLLARSEVGGEADHAGLLAVLVEEDRSRDRARERCAPSLVLSTLSKPEAVPPRLRISTQHVLRALLALVELVRGAADDLFGAIAQQGLGALVEQDDVAVLVGGDDGVGRAFDQPRQVTLGLLDLGVRLERAPARLACAR